MKSFLAVCLPLVLARTSFAVQAIAKEEGHPVEKVIGMLRGLMQDVTRELQEEEYLFGKFQHWCKNSKKTLDVAIAGEKEKIEELGDTIEAKTEEIKTLTTQIDELLKQVKQLDIDDADALKLRKKEENLYKHTDKQLGETITGIQDAIMALQKAQRDTDTGLFLQVQGQVRGLIDMVQTRASATELTLLSEFSAQTSTAHAPAPAPVPFKDRPDFYAEGDRSAHVKQYAFKSEKVIELLKQLKIRFEGEQLEVVKAETNAVNAYELAKAAREDERNAANKAKLAKEEEKDDAEGEKTTAENTLKSTQEDLKEDSAMLDLTIKKCEVKAAQWEERQKTRSLEMDAIQAAIKILGTVADVRTEAPENPVPPPSPIADPANRLSFLQVRGKPIADARLRAVELLRRAARTSNSKALERFAQEMAAHVSGPFDEVNNMIEKMIFHLMAEQKDEDEHKHWCDLELNKTDASIADKVDKMDELQVKISEAESYIGTLTTEIQDDNEMVAKIDMHMKESLEIREAGKAENAAAIKDAKEAQEAIANAIAVLETHYKETGMMKKESWEFVQRQPVQLPKSPSTWSASYTGVMDPTSDVGIISVLQKISADFSEMEADTKVQEETDQKFYEEEKKECEIEKATRLKDAEVKDDERKRQVEKADTLKSEKKHVSDEHDTTVQYLKDLQKACVEGTSTYEARKADRAKEIEALHQAQDILKDAFKEPVSFLNKKSLRAL